MSNSKQGGDLYRPIIKEGTHLAPSRKTPGAYRGTQLSDANNQINGQTEWVKVEESDYDYNYDSSYGYEGSREGVELTEEQREMAAMIGEAAATAIIALVAAAAPHVKNWWQENVALSIKKTWQGIPGKRKTISQKKYPVRSTKLAATNGSFPGLFSQELDEAYEKYVNDMTSEEAQRELLDIFILSAVVAAKIRKLANSRIVNDENPYEYIEGKEVIEKLSTPQFVDSINRILQGNPNLLEEKSPALSVILGLTLVVDGEYLPIENEALREALALKS